MTSKLKSAGRLLKETYAEWKEDKALRLGAALSYYTVFSLPPLLVLVVAVAGLVFGAEAARGQIVKEFQGLIGQGGTETVQTMIAQASKPKTGRISTLVSVAVLLLGATGVFTQLQDALNTIWDVRPKPGVGIRYTLKIRAISLALVLAIAFLLLVSLVISSLLAAFGGYISSIVSGVPMVEALLHGVNFLVSFGIITLLFALMFKTLPDAKIAWGDVWLGAAFTAFLFTIGKYLIGLYLGKSDVGTAYGAAGSLVLILLWVFYSSQILFFGAEFTQVYANRYGSRIFPGRHAMRIGAGERAKQGMEEKRGGDGDGRPVPERETEERR